VALRRFLVVWLAAACSSRGTPGGPVEVAFALDRADSAFGSVRVTGLSRVERALVTREGGGVAVHAEDDSLVPGTPPLSGAWRVAGETLVFTPRFLPGDGVTLWVRVDEGALGRNEGSPARRWHAKLPRAAAPADVRVVGIHPSTDTLPENLLRWYVEFSHAMRPGFARDLVRLVDAAGRDDATAFLDVSEELWDPGHRRLTLLFDPGRVKRGVRTHVEQGRPLKAGSSYVLVVEPGWEEMSGGRVLGRVEKAFVVRAADHEGPDPARWELLLPAVGTRAPLRMAVHDLLDHALATRLIRITGSGGGAVPGEAKVDHDTRTWSFTPERAWSAGAYQVQVSPELEDVSGNRPGLPFDRQASREVGGGGGRVPLVRGFSLAVDARGPGVRQP